MTKEGITAIYPTTSNPPTFGTIYSLMSVCHEYDKIYVVVRDTNLVMSPKNIKRMLEKVLCMFTTKFVVIISDHDFAHDTAFTGMPPYDEIITTDADILANLKSKGYIETRLIPKPIGWDDTFHRVAYYRSAIYTRIRNNITDVPMFKEKNKEMK